ncbi:MAG: DUF86 domain-containing protein [Candidatus Magnetobacterium sp. LHC-1]|uniref:DUF86 domain-containing protein n=1 Tax=Candidatus Magnetobacterium casense TaxID=1455061 RepID=A0ABS6RWJ2_9BACT|nr:DUF86 domain-containing protein [Candidatus Magnetobacterium casensis]MBF0607341.1 DUF86 domain-containing protein [Nitrospirota bacterium]MBV6340995.1 DUF86 domain-containing protein [Candidatus Magnetobacterium casensis]
MLERIKRLEGNLAELLRFRERFGLDGILSDKHTEWALRYGYLETIQVIIDIACHIVSKYNLGNPSTYAECIKLLARYDYLDEGLTAKLTAMVGLRNMLIHQYQDIDAERLYQLLNSTDDIRRFAEQVRCLI